MKLSTFHGQIDALWKTSSLFQLGAWLILVSVAAYATNRYLARQYSSAKVYLIFSIALVLVVGLLESTPSASAVLSNPITAMLLAGCAGAGVEVYRRLIGV